MPAELRPGRRVLLLDREVRLQRADRVRQVVLRDVRVGEVLVALRRIRLDLGLRLRDRVAAAAEDAVVELLEAPAVPGTDAERDEREREDDRERGEHPLLLAAQPREEEVLVRIAAGGVPPLLPRRLRRRLRLRLLRLLRLYRCPGHQAPRVAELERASRRRRSTSTASQIEPSNSIHIGSSSRNVVTGSGPGSASATAAVMK